MTFYELIRPLPGWLVMVFAIGLGLAIGWSPWLAIPGVIGGIGIAIWILGTNRDGGITVAGKQADTKAPDSIDHHVEKDIWRDWEALIDAIDDPMLVLAERRVIIANSTANEMFGDHVAGQDIRVGIRHPAVANLLSDYEQTGMTQRCKLKGFGGPERRWQMQIGRLGSDMSLVRLTDLSQMAASERVRTDFVANASHELRTPIAAILGFVETLSDRAAGDDVATRERFLEIMGTEARRMQQLVDDLISLSRIEADLYAPPDGNVDLAGIADNVARQITATGGAAPGQIVVEADAPGAHVVADAAQIEQVLYNLVGNALKYGRAGAPVRVRIADDNGMIRLTVADEGDGIPARHLPRLTERFYRVDAGRSRARGGTGLGLAIVKNIVERHRGTLDFASTQGVGTTVTVRLPKAAPSLS